MRYWVYKDAQIVGPLAREDLARGRLRADTLVCEENSSGERDMDWRCAEEVPELSGLYLTGEAPPSILDRLGWEDSLLERLQFEASASETGEAQGEWLSGVWGPTALRADTRDISAELAASQKRVQELTEKLEGLTSLPRPDALPRSPEPSAWQAPPPAAIPDLPAEAPPAAAEPRLSQPPAAIELPPMPAFPQPEPAPEPPKEAMAPESLGQEAARGNALKFQDQAPRPEVKFGETKRFLSVRKKTSPPAEAALKPAVSPSSPELAPSEPPKPELLPSEPPKEAAAAERAEPSVPKHNVLKFSGQTAKQGVKLGATKSFISVRKEAVPAPIQAAIPAPPPASIPTPVPLPISPPTPVPPPAPAPMPTPVPSPVSVAPTLPPMPTFQPMAAAAAPSPEPPVTTAYSDFFSSPPSLVAAPQPVSHPAVKPAMDEALGLGRLAKPQAAATAATLEPKPKRGDKKFLIISALLVGGLVVAGLMFFNDSKSIESAVNMGDDQEPLGTAAVQEEGEKVPAPAPSPEPVSAPPPAAEPVEQVVTSPEQVPEAAPAAAPIVAVQDDRPAAIELVKGFPLDGDRGTVGRWLQYSFTASPGFNEKWDAGAVEDSTFLVQYTVQDSGKSMRPAITYLFEADVARRTVRGKNPAARELLSGSQAPVKTPRKAPRKPRARRSAPVPAAIAPKQLPLLPLPSDTDLLPPSEEGASFQSDMVQPGL